MEGPMYRVLLVDDERWICKLISSIVDWNALGFEIIADAGDGKTAWKLIDQHRPDLVVTDIRMPGMDGIELIRTAREAELDTEFIIISGYNDFEYAKNAITYGASAYLLKPLDENELSETLIRLKDKLSRKRAFASTLTAERQRQMEVGLLALLQGKEKDITVQEFNHKYATTFFEEEFCVVGLYIDEEEGKSPVEYQLGELLAQWKTHAGRFLMENVILEGKPAATAAILFNYRHALVDELPGYCALLQELFRERYPSSGATLTLGIGIPGGFSNIQRSVKSARYALQARMALGLGSVICAAEYASRLQPLRGLIPVDTEKKLVLAIEMGEEQQAVQLTTSLMNAAYKRLEEHPLYCHVMADEIAALFFSSVKRRGIAELTWTELSLRRMMDGCATYPAMEAFMEQLAREAARAFQNASNGEDKAVQMIKQFVSAHYSEDISLNDLARLVCLSPNYVSELFKKQTGENFSDYLIDYRLSVAKDLLRDVKYKVVDVSEMVGYADAKYFSRIFKKRVGVNPNAYRRLHP